MPQQVNYQNDRLGEKSVIRIAALILVLGSLGGTAVSQKAVEYRNYYFGYRYEFRLTSKQLLSTPAWPDDELNPPLSARLALSAARGYLRTLFDDETEWRLDEIKLVPVVERWIYVVTFIPPPRRCQDCFTIPFQIIVTMDGNAVPAAVSRSKTSTPPPK